MLKCVMLRQVLDTMSYLFYIIYPDIFWVIDVSKKMLNKIKRTLSQFPDIEIAILYGSVASGIHSKKSDVDIAVLKKCPLNYDERISLITALSRDLKREVDILDLNSAGNFILKKVLTGGKVIINRNQEKYESLIKKMIYYTEDFLPYQRRILKERRKRWIGI